MMNAALEVLHKCNDVIVPSLFFLFGMHRGNAGCTEHFFGHFRIQRVAVTQADPRKQTAGKQIVNDRVDPFPMVDAFFGFGARPAGLNANPLDAECRNLVVSLFGVEYAAVELFKAEAHAGGLHFGRMLRNYFSDRNQMFHEKIPLFFWIILFQRDRLSYR